MLDGVYRSNGDETVFHEARVPTRDALQRLLDKIVLRLMRMLTRPAIAHERLSRNGQGQVVLQLKSAWPPALCRAD